MLRIDGHLRLFLMLSIFLLGFNNTDLIGDIPNVNVTDDIMMLIILMKLWVTSD